MNTRTRARLHVDRFADDRADLLVLLASELDLDRLAVGRRSLRSSRSPRPSARRVTVAHSPPPSSVAADLQLVRARVAGARSAPRCADGRDTRPPADRAAPCRSCTRPWKTLTWPRKSMTNGVAGCSKTSSGVPSCSIWPSFITTTRSATSNASSWSCVTKTLVTWISSCSRRSQLPQLLPHLGVERAERLVEQQHLRLGRERAGQRDALPLAAGELRRDSGRRGRRAGPASSSSWTRRRISASAGRWPRGARAGRRRRSRRPSCGGRARSAGRRSRRCVARRARRVASSPSNSTVPRSATSSPAMMRSSVVLPEPDGPSSASSAPSATVKLTSFSATKLPNVLRDAVDVDAHDGPVGTSSAGAPVVARCASRRSTPALHDQGHEGQQRQQRRDGERRRAGCIPGTASRRAAASCRSGRRCGRRRRRRRRTRPSRGRCTG